SQKAWAASSAQVRGCRGPRPFRDLTLCRMCSCYVLLTEDRIMPDRRTYAGQCHCGAVKFEVTTDLGALMDCNCSRCSRLGWVMQPVPASDFTLLQGEDKLKLYQFNTHAIRHLFCTECGIQS